MKTVQVCEPVRTLVKRGKELTQAELDAINEGRAREFGSLSAHGPLDPRPGHPSWEQVHLLVEDAGGRLLAFGRLHEVAVEFMGRTYPILGIATIFAAVKGRGYGALLVHEMKVYVLQTGRTAIGFCPASTTPFYRKCGIDALAAGAERFVYREPSGRLHREGSYDVLYITGSDHLIERVLANPGEIMYLPRPLW